MELDRGGWSWVELGARFSNTRFYTVTFFSVKINHGFNLFIFESVLQFCFDIFSEFFSLDFLSFQEPQIHRMLPYFDFISLLSLNFLKGGQILPQQGVGGRSVQFAFLINHYL